jgi:hypothetical protein
LLSKTTHETAFDAAQQRQRHAAKLASEVTFTGEKNWPLKQPL